MWNRDSSWEMTSSARTRVYCDASKHFVKRWYIAPVLARVGHVPVYMNVIHERNLRYKSKTRTSGYSIAARGSTYYLVDLYDSSNCPRCGKFRCMILGPHSISPQIIHGEVKWRILRPIFPSCLIHQIALGASSSQAGFMGHFLTIHNDHHDVEKRRVLWPQKVVLTHIRCSCKERRVQK